MRKLAHPVVVFIVAVCCVIGVGVGVLAATGNGGLSLALTCAPPGAHVLGPPGARFTVKFPGSVTLFVPTGVVAKAPDYELCDYQVRTPKSPLTGVDISVNTYPHFSATFKRTAEHVTNVTAGAAKGQQILACYSKAVGCRGLMVVQSRGYQWFVVGTGTNTVVIDSFFRAFRATS